MNSFWGLYFYILIKNYLNIKNNISIILIPLTLTNLAVKIITNLKSNTFYAVFCETLPTHKLNKKTSVNFVLDKEKVYHD